nr:apolipoprotein N-acyltransferase [Pseudonocardia sp. C8]
MRVPPTAGAATGTPGPSAARRRRDAGLAAVVALLGGVLLYLSFPPRDGLWWLALPAFTLLGLVLRDARPRRGFLAGFTFGLGFLLPLLVWTGSFVGSLPWVVLSAFEALFLGLTGAVMALVSRVPGRLAALWPVWAAAVWVGGELLRGSVPFGGFPWGRVGFGQPESPLLPVAALGGVPLLSFGTVLSGLALAELLRRVLVRRGPAAGDGHAAARAHGVGSEAREDVAGSPPAGPATTAGGGHAAIAVPAVLLVLVAAAGPLAALVPATPGAPARTVTVAAIQGNVPRLGLDFNAQRRAVLDNHARQTEILAADVAAGRRPQPDVVVWPENSSDIDPLRNPDAAARIDAAARAVRAPIMVGAVLVNPGRTTSNAALVWEAGTGVVDRQDKRRIQPFGEYMPWRSFFRLFSSYVDRAGFFVPGDGDGLLTIAGIPTAVAICWEIAFDDAFGDAVDAGAQLLAVPSNNATFGLSEMTYQQLAMSRVRAVELDRPVVVVTTSGVSAMITPDGAVTDATGQFEPGVLVDRVDLRTTTTLSARLRSGPEWMLTVTGLLAAGLALGASRGRHGDTARRSGAVGSSGREARAGKDGNG